MGQILETRKLEPIVDLQRLECAAGDRIHQVIPPLLMQGMEHSHQPGPHLGVGRTTEPADRVAAGDTQLGGWEIPAGARIFPCAYLAQRDPEVFPEPAAFRPERFLEGRSYEGSWFPFGLGARTCIGNRFALRQMRWITATAVRHADLVPAPGYEPAPVRRLVLVLPRQGGRMVLRQRREAA